MSSKLQKNNTKKKFAKLLHKTKKSKNIYGGYTMSKKKPSAKSAKKMPAKSAQKRHLKIQNLMLNENKFNLQRKNNNKQIQEQIILNNSKISKLLTQIKNTNRDDRKETRGQRSSSNMNIDRPTDREEQILALQNENLKKQNEINDINDKTNDHMDDLTNMMMKLETDQK